LLDIELQKYQKLVIFLVRQSTEFLLIFGQLYPIIAKKIVLLNRVKLEIDASYFGARRIKGKRGRGASGKTPVFGLSKRECKVYTQIVKNCSKSFLIPIIEDV